MQNTPPKSLENVIDGDVFEPHRIASDAVNPLEWPGYERALEQARENSGADESVVAAGATIAGHAVETAAFEFSFMGGSMGERAGEVLASALERAAQRRVPFVLRTATGGARMQEGMRSLIQMPKVVTARLMLGESHQPFIAVLGHPTTGGVLASLAALADVTIAEDQATIGFAGPRVAERVTGKPLAATSHAAASALRNGLVDAVIGRETLRATLATVLGIVAARETTGVSERSPEPYRAATPAMGSRSPGDDIRDTDTDAWAAVETARAARRPLASTLAREISESSFELRGDRAGRDDASCVALLSRVAGRAAVVLALDRTDLPGPGAYRKAVRCLDIAARLRLPVVTLVDTRGADPSEKSEAGGIAWAIASLFEKMLTTPVPIVSVVTGEGGSGGALAFATGDVLIAYADSIFSVIAPQLAAEILWRDAGRAPDAARLLKPTAHDLHRLGVADEVLSEPVGAASLRDVVAYHLAGLDDAWDAEETVARRRARWRSKVGY